MIRRLLTALAWVLFWYTLSTGVFVWVFATALVTSNPWYTYKALEMGLWVGTGTNIFWAWIWADHSRHF